MICRWILVFNMVALVFVLDSLPCNAREVNLIRDDSFEFTDNYRNFVEKHPGVGNNAAILKWYKPQYLPDLVEMYVIDVGPSGKYATIKILDKNDFHSPDTPRYVKAVAVEHHEFTDDKVWLSAIIGVLDAIGTDKNVTSDILGKINKRIGSTTRTYSQVHGGYIYTRVDRISINSPSFAILIFANDE